MEGKTLSIKNLLLLQGVVVIFSLVSVLSKFASGESFFSLRFLLFFGAELVVLAIYAVLWQQVIKRFDISIAYANKAMVLLWGLLWSVVIFREKITLQKALGVLIVIAGVVILNLPEKAKAQPAKRAEEEVSK